MNQIRNLIINIFLNVLCLSLYIFSLSLLPPNDKQMGLVFEIVVFIVGILIYLVIFVVIRIIFGDDIPLYIPHGCFVFPYLFFKYLQGNVKMVVSSEYKYISRYSIAEERIFVYVFTPLGIQREYYTFSGDISHLKTKILTLHIRLNPHLDNNKFNYKDWDGSLDQESKRNNTIDKILK